MAAKGTLISIKTRSEKHRSIQNKVFKEHGREKKKCTGRREAWTEKSRRGEGVSGRIEHLQYAGMKV